MPRRARNVNLGAQLQVCDMKDGSDGLATGQLPL